MAQQDGIPGSQSPSAEQIELALTRIEDSAAFRTSPRHRMLLRYVVARLVEGDLAALKETIIAVAVYGRNAAKFDPKLDSIVRVEARRLRARLTGYYRTDGRNAHLRIALPIGSYVPLIAHRTLPQHVPEATRRARDLVERGEHFLRQSLSRASLEQALERFDAALRESPDYAPANVGAGRAWLNLATGWYVEPAIASAHASEALRRALAQDAQNPVAHALLGAIQHQFEHDWPAADRSFRRALSLAPQEAFVRSAYGMHLLMHGALEDAERELQLARGLDPQYINTRRHMVNLRIAQGRLDDAEAEIEALHDLSPDTMSIVALRGAIAMFRSDADTAIRHYERACAVMPDYPGCFVALAGAYAMAGRIDEADALMSRSLARLGDAPVSPYVLAIFATRRQRRNEAFALLERAYRERDPLAMQIPSDPSFEDLRGDPRWAALLANGPTRPRARRRPPDRGGDGAQSD